MDLGTVASALRDCYEAFVNTDVSSPLDALVSPSRELIHATGIHCRRSCRDVGRNAHL